MNDAVVLICDENISVHETLHLYLQEAGFHVLSAYDGESALDTLLHNHVDLLVSAVMLPSFSGLDLCRQIRKNSDLPIIFLSAKTDVADRIAGLEAGADDYVTKPFSPKEVVTRAKTILRRIHPRKNDTILTLGNLRVDPRAYEVYVCDQRIKTTPREVELLSFLIRNAGQVASREAILNAVWGYDYYGDMRTVDTLLARLRSKIPEQISAVSFRSIYGVGYMIEALPSQTM